MIYDVVIAGAGPVGLFLACELRLADLSVLVLEQAEDSRSPLKRLPFGRRGLSAPTIEAFYRRGWLNDIAALEPVKTGLMGGGVSGAGARQPRHPAGHFAGIQFDADKIDSSKWPYRLPSPAGASMAVEMEQLESALSRRASAMGVEIRRGVGVEAFDPSDDNVTVCAGGETFRGRWLVGCDGGRSTVRKAGGFDFVGTDPEFTGYTVRVEMADPEKLSQGRTYTPTGMYFQSRPGTIAMVEFDGGAFHRSQPLTLEQVQGVLRRVSDTDVTVTALRLATTWTDRACQAVAYRKGRVLLAGDAAHIHSPLGGQGLNLGLVDAMNLGWKLASTIRGDAPAGLIDSYLSERHPVGAQVLDWSRAQVALMRPSQSSRARSHHPRSHRHARRRDILRPSACGAFLSAMILAAVIRWWAGAPPISSWSTGRGSANSSETGKACCWTLTCVRRLKRSQTAGAVGSHMSQATRTIG